MLIVAIVVGLVAAIGIFLWGYAIGQANAVNYIDERERQRRNQ